MKKTKAWLREHHSAAVIDALDQFIGSHIKNPNTVGIILTGSYVHSIPDPNSDLDVHIVLNESETRERGNTWINGYEIEYFINPIKQIEYYFETDREKNTAHMFTESIILYQNVNYTKEFETLLTKAKEKMDSPVAPMTSEEIEIAKYILDDQKKDLSDTWVKKDLFSFYLIANSVLANIIRYFLAFNQVLPVKPKQLQQVLAKLNPFFEKLLLECFNEPLIENKYQHILELISLLEKEIGGARSKEWKFITRCPYLESKTEVK